MVTFLLLLAPMLPVIDVIIGIGIFYVIIRTLVKFFKGKGGNNEVKDNSLGINDRE